MNWRGFWGNFDSKTGETCTCAGIDLTVQE
jgi:hypothetical protein